MSIDTIYDTLAQAAPDDQLDLSPNAFGTGPIQSLFTTYLPGDGHLRGHVQSLAKDSTRERVALVATGSAAPLNKTTFTAYFSDSTEGVQVELSAEPADGWALPDAFPVFANSFVTDLSLGGATLKLDSGGTSPDAAGQHFNATLSLDGAWAAVAWLVGGVTRLELSGPIRLEHGVPAFDFKVPIPERVTIGTLKDLDVAFEFSSTVEARQVTPVGGGRATTMYAPVLRFGVGATIPLGPDRIDLFVDLSIPGGAVTVSADVATTGPLSLSDFASMVGDADLSGSLPQKSVYDPGSTFGLAALSMAVTPRGKSLDWIDLTLRAQPNWTILSDVELSDIVFSLRVFTPVSGATVQASLMATIDWPDGSLVVGGTAPQVTLFVSMVQGSKIHLLTLLNKLLETDVPGDLILDEFSFTVTPSEGSFDLTTGITGDWPVNLGVVTAKLEKAWLQLDRSAGETTGTIAARADVGIVEFDGSWNIPGSFTLTGALNEQVHLTDLAKHLTRASLPSGIPDIVLTEASATISVASQPAVRRAFALASAGAGSTVYTFAARASAAAGKVDLGTALFEVRVADGTYGFLAGFVVPAAWSPGDLAPGLKPLFDGLRFQDSGLLVSSLSTDNIDLPILKQKSLPQSIQPGIIAFTSLKLEGDGIGLLAHLFSTNLTLDLVALLDTTTPAKSVITASLGGMQKHGALTFLDLQLILKPGVGSIALKADIQLKLGNETVTISGSGEVVVEPSPKVSVSLVVSNWKEPFGIKGLTIEAFGIGIGIEAAGVTIGFLGRFLIGTGERQFTFMIGGEIIDFEAPGAIVFALEATHQTLMLSDLITQFTDLDLSQVPVLNAVGFKNLDFTVVDDPAGFTIGTQHFDPGIRIAADITIYQWEAQFDLAVNTSKGVYAKGALSKPIVIGENLLVISNVAGDKGPEGLIDTSAFVSGASTVRREGATLREVDLTRTSLPAAIGQYSPPVLATIGPSEVPVLVTSTAATYLELDATISLLNVYKQALKVSVSKDTFDFLYEFVFLGIKEQLTCHFSEAQKNFAASASFQFALDIELPELKIAGVTVFPAVHLVSPRAGLDLGVALAWSGGVSGSLGLAVSFAWKDIDFNFSASLSLADVANALDNLWKALSAWMKDHVRKIFDTILGDIDAYLKALEAGVFTLAGGAVAIAEALVALFSASAKQVAEALHALGEGFKAVVEAIAKVFGMAVDDAVKIVTDIYGQCAMTGADVLMYGDPAVITVDTRFLLPPSVLIDVQQTVEGQRFAYHYYAHQEELGHLLMEHPDVRFGVQRLTHDSPYPLSEADDSVPVGSAMITVLDLLVPYASPQLRASIEELRPELERTTVESYDDLLGSLTPIGGSR